MENHQTPVEESEAKLTLDDLILFEDLIGNKMLPEKPEGLTYDLSIELSKLRSFIKRQQSRVKILKENYTFKDGDKKPILYIVKISSTGSQHLVPDADGSWMTIKEEADKARIPYITMIDLDNEEYKSTIKKHTEDDIDFKFKKIPGQKIKDLYAAGKFSGLDLSPLFGHLFDPVE